jgi:hypothetical protein
VINLRSIHLNDCGEGSMVDWPSILNGVSTDVGKAVLAAAATLAAALATALATWKKDPLGNSQRSRRVKEALERVKFWTEWEALLGRVGNISELDRERIRVELQRVALEVRVSCEPQSALFYSRQEFALFRADLPVYRRFALLYPLPSLYGMVDGLPKNTGRRLPVLFILRVLRWLASMMHWFLPILVVMDTFLSAHVWLDLLRQGDLHLFYREQTDLWQSTVAFAFLTWFFHLLGRACEEAFLSFYLFPHEDLP